MDGSNYRGKVTNYRGKVNYKLAKGERSLRTQ